MRHFYHEGAQRQCDACYRQAPPWQLSPAPVQVSPTQHGCPAPPQVAHVDELRSQPSVASHALLAQHGCPDAPQAAQVDER